MDCPTFWFFSNVYKLFFLGEFTTAISSIPKSRHFVQGRYSYSLSICPWYSFSKTWIFILNPFLLLSYIIFIKCNMYRMVSLFQILSYILKIQKKKTKWILLTMYFLYLTLENYNVSQFFASPVCSLLHFNWSKPSLLQTGINVKLLYYG